MSFRPNVLLSLPSYLAGQVAKIGRAPLRDALASHGLVLPQYAIVATLDQFGPCSQQEIAQRLEIDKSNIVKLLDDLVEGGYVERRVCATDRRRHGISVTTAGRELVADIDLSAADEQAEMLHALSGPERAQLIALMRRVIDNHDQARLS